MKLKKLLSIYSVTISTLIIQLIIINAMDISLETLDSYNNQKINIDFFDYHTPLNYKLEYFGNTDDINYFAIYIATDKSEEYIDYRNNLKKWSKNMTTLDIPKFNNFYKIMFGSIDNFIEIEIIEFFHFDDRYSILTSLGDFFISKDQSTFNNIPIKIIIHKTELDCHFNKSEICLVEIVKKQKLNSL